MWHSNGHEWINLCSSSDSSKWSDCMIEEASGITSSSPTASLFVDQIIYLPFPFKTPGQHVTTLIKTATSVAPSEAQLKWSHSNLIRDQYDWSAWGIINNRWRSCFRLSFQRLTFATQIPLSYKQSTVIVKSFWWVKELILLFDLNAISDLSV